MNAWQVGDVAYCTDARRARSILEAGRTYTVARVIPVPAHVGCGLALVEAAPPEPLEGFWSNRFLRLERGKSRLRQIDVARKSHRDA